MARDRIAPVANITAPANGAQVASASITITGTGVDAAGVTNIKLFVGGIQVASQNFTASPNVTRSVSVSYTLPAQGVYTLRCEARDKAGNVGIRNTTVTYSNTTTTTTLVPPPPPPPPPTLPSRKIITAHEAINQFSEGSCAACAGSLMMSIEKYHVTGATTYSKSTNILSPEYLYNLSLAIGGNLTNPCGQGTSPSSIYQIAKTKGTCTWDVLPYSDGYNPGSCQYDPITGQLIPNTCVWTYPCQQTIYETTPTCYCSVCSTCCIGATQDTSAAEIKATGRSYLATSDFYNIKRALNNNHGVYLSFQMDRNFYNAGGGDCNYIWKTRGELMFNHGVMIIGYDDAKQAWLIQNSWGPEWGCNGRIWADYNFLTTFVSTVWFVTTRNDLNYFPII